MSRVIVQRAQPDEQISEHIVRAALLSSSICNYHQHLLLFYTEYLTIFRLTWSCLHNSVFQSFSQTSSNNVQEIIESRIEKRIKGVYVPTGGKKMLVFLDDLNMPAMDDFGSQPPLELLRLWIDYGFWYDRQKQTLKYIKVRRCVCFFTS